MTSSIISSSHQNHFLMYINELIITKFLVSSSSRGLPVWVVTQKMFLKLHSCATSISAFPLFIYLWHLLINFLNYSPLKNSKCICYYRKNTHTYSLLSVLTEWQVCTDQCQRVLWRNRHYPCLWCTFIISVVQRASSFEVSSWWTYL